MQKLRELLVRFVGFRGEAQTSFHALHYNLIATYLIRLQLTSLRSLTLQGYLDLAPETMAYVFRCEI